MNGNWGKASEDWSDHCFASLHQYDREEDICGGRSAMLEERHRRIFSRLHLRSDIVAQPGCTSLQG